MKTKKKWIWITLAILIVILGTAVLWARYCYPVITETYVIRRADGRWYLDFADGNERIDLNEGCIIYSPEIVLSSIDELYQILKAGQFPETTLGTIRHGFPFDREKGFFLPDPDKLYEPQIPAGMTVKYAYWCGEAYGVYFRTESKKDNGSPTISGDFKIIPKSDFESSLYFFERFSSGRLEYDSAKEIPDRNAIAYDCVGEVNTVRYLQYTVKIGRKTLYVQENYLIAHTDPAATVSETIPSSVHICGEEDGVYFSLVFGSIDVCPDIQWLAEWKMVPFKP